MTGLKVVSFQHINPWSVAHCDSDCADASGAWLFGLGVLEKKKQNKPFFAYASSSKLLLLIFGYSN